MRRNSPTLFRRLGRPFVLLAVALALGVTAERTLAPKAALRQVSQPEAYTRPEFAYSVVPKGVYTQDEVHQAVNDDALVAAHYSGVQLSRLKTISAGKSEALYVSFRKDNRIYWTSRPVTIPAGETVLSDGANTIRARCGNRLSPHPQVPVYPAPGEPKPEEFDRPSPPRPVGALPVPLPGGSMSLPTFDIASAALAPAGSASGWGPSSSFSGLLGNSPLARESSREGMPIAASQLEEPPVEFGLGPHMTLPSPPPASYTFFVNLPETLNPPRGAAGVPNGSRRGRGGESVEKIPVVPETLIPGLLMADDLLLGPDPDASTLNDPADSSDPGPKSGPKSGPESSRETPSDLPEPATLPLVCAALAGIALARRRLRTFTASR